MRTAGPHGRSASAPRFRFAAGALAGLLFPLAGGAGAQTPKVTLAPPALYDLSESEPHQLLAADLDLDGHLDLVTATTGGMAADGRVEVRWGDGAGGFDETTELVAGHAPWAVAAGDVDGDGLGDVVAAESGTGFATVRVFRHGRARSFAAAPSLTAESFPIGIICADFDGDGARDLVVAANVGSPALTFFRGHGDATFAPGAPVAGSGGYHATRLASADLDLDGHLDLAMSHDSGCRVFRGHGDGTFSSAGSAGTSVLTEAVAAGDLDGDGLPDLATVEIYSSLLRIARGHGDGTFTTIASLATGGFPRDVAIADLTGDGRADVVVPCQSEGRLRVWCGLGSGAFAPPQLFAAPPEPMAVAAGDWDEDGLTDLAAVERNLGDTPPLSVHLQVLPDPVTYCTAMTNSQGCTPAIATSGSPSASGSASFLVTAAQVVNQKSGILLYGFASASTPFMGGTLCLASPLRRTPAQFSGGSPSGADCTGVLAYDFNERIRSGIDPALLPGIEVFCQWWYRDPPAAFAVGLSDAARFVIGP